MTEQKPSAGTDPRAEAIERLKKRRDFVTHVLVYLLMNGFLVLIWLLVTSPGFFWPVFSIGFWGIGLVLHAWDTFGPARFSEKQIRREMGRRP
ncbi:2TM domain-containing protein [Amycolatopsis acidicola]|uniref:2TM domain-containing protein n=1 Tax=Amycolatopsis acidicola TaxID=2596893 RepID=A0A5N0V357_9PSEU|nr:2TM domain-containing protein [Amycolatopsis acidicola]KAA9160234.1 2TM domain-containing protein [Amycolatopsis acidicola]